MNEKINAINPEVLVWARETSGIELLEANKYFNSLDKVSLWETGEDYPTYPQIKKLGKLYRKPIAIFFFPNPPILKSIVKSFRTLPENIYSSLSPNLLKHLDKARIMQMNLSELYSKQEKDYINFSSIRFDLSTENRVFYHLRELMNTPIEEQILLASNSIAFEFWRNALRKIGVFVFKEAFNDDSVSGFCIYDENFPIIYINNKFSFSRQIFTLFHELCHLIYQTNGIDFLNDEKILNDNYTNIEIERMCNNFAGDFLVPIKDFSKFISTKSVTEDLVYKASKRYKVSREVILVKMLRLKMISVDFYLEKKDLYGEEYLRNIKYKETSGGNYYNTQIAYKGKKYIELAFTQYYQNKITIKQLGTYMDMKYGTLKKFASVKGWANL